ncbi:MAG: glycosyltransferase, partial [Clostridia bacterium]|nr:glycosyltransferase [Clostridia bacterium]
SLKKTKLKKFKKPSLKKFHHSKPTELIYFTTEIEKYMKISDLIITKPGGLTVSEALACNLPMAIFDAIPGQEEENAEFLIKNNMAIQLGKDFSSKESITALLKDSKQLIKMKEACISFDKSDSKENILKEIIRLVNEKNNSSI